MPPRSGSIRRSSAWLPRRLLTSSPIETSCSGALEGTTMSIPALARPAGERMPDRTSAPEPPGTPAISRGGSGRSLSVHTNGWSLEGAISSSPRPISRHRSTPAGTRASSDSAPTSSGLPAKLSVRILPPRRSPASSTVTSRSAPALARRCAAARPAMPAPTMAILGRSSIIAAPARRSLRAARARGPSALPSRRGRR